MQMTSLEVFFKEMQINLFVVNTLIRQYSNNEWEQRKHVYSNM